MLRGHFVGCRAVVRALRVFASLAAVAFAASSKVTGGSNTEDDGPKTEVVSLDRKDFVEIFMGVADGFGLDLVEACVKSDVAFEQNIKAAVLEFKKDTEAGMKTALKYLADAFEKDLPSAVKECKGTYDQVQAVLESIASFASPTSFAYHVGKELLVNGVDIFENIKTAVTSWQQEDYHFFGVSVGHALKDVILGVKLDPEDAVSLMQGVVSGLTDTEVTATCVSSSEKLVQDLQKIANALEKNTRAGMAEAMLLLSILVERTLPEVSKSCADSKAALEVIKEKLESFKTVKELIEHLGMDLISNAAAIEEDGKAALAAYQEGQWEDCGRGLGKALRLLLIGGTSSKMNGAVVTTSKELGVVGGLLRKGNEILGASSSAAKNNYAILDHSNQAELYI